ncbi:restriction endonuclease subunit S [Acinetobacter towneri]|nr:restriction endonuclease subunit S [Acinetobacter towneri]MEB6565244.1 restriction endonuclease subunit S [Acinetobacter towneri]
MATPKLRFKDFGEDWTAKKLSQVANLTSSKRVHLSDYVSEGIPFFRGKEITELKSGIFPKDILYISKKQYEDFKEKFGAPQNNEILMTAVGTLANTYLINTDFEFYFKDGNLIWFKDINADPNFLMILLDARKNDVLASAIGSTQKALTIANLNKLIFNFPSNEEQTKIASFLSNVDEKISQLTQKHELLSQYKQGMMQKLFSQQIRFKADDGSEFGEWEERKLGEVCRFVNGRAYKQTEWEKEGTPVIRLQNLTGSGKEYYYSNLNLPDHQYCYNNDLLYMWSATFGPVFWQGEKAIFHYHIWKIEVNPQLLDKKYMYFLLDEMTEKMKRSLNGSTMLHVTKQGMENTEKIIPSLPEQTKIANFLSAIDQKVEVVAQQIEQAKQWKKGLLQQMFV